MLNVRLDEIRFDASRWRAEPGLGEVASHTGRSHRFCAVVATPALAGVAVSATLI